MSIRFPPFLNFLREKKKRGTEDYTKATIWREGYICNGKEQSFYHLPKPGKDLGNPDNYRPLTLTQNMKELMMTVYFDKKLMTPCREKVE